MLLPAIATAIVVFVATSSPRPPLRRYGLVLGGLGTMIVAAAVILLGSRNAPGGAYGPLLDQAPAVRDVLEWTVWHVAVFALALGIVALMAFPAAVARLLGRGATSAERSLGATAAALSVWVLASVVALSASPYGLGFLHERSLFFLAPLVLACLAHWLGHGLPRRGAVAVLSAVAVVAAIAALPERFVERSNVFDYPALRPVAVLFERAPLDSAARVARGRCAGSAPRSSSPRGARSRRSRAWSSRSSPSPERSPGPTPSRRPRRAASHGSTRRCRDPRGRCSCTSTCPRWRAHSCGRRPWFEQQALGVWTEFFNTRIDRVAHVYGQNEAAGIPSPELVVAPGGGVLLTEDGRSLAPRYVVLDSRQPIAGTRLRRFDLDPAVTRLPRRRLAVALARRGAAAARSPARAAAAAGRRPPVADDQASSSRYAASWPRAAASHVKSAPARGRARPTAPGRGARRRPRPRSPRRWSGRTAVRRRRRPRRPSRSRRRRPGSRTPSPRAAGMRSPRTGSGRRARPRAGRARRARRPGRARVPRRRRVAAALVPAAGEHEPQLRALAPQERERLQQPLVVLVRPRPRRVEQERLACLVARGHALVVDPVRDDAEPLGGDAQEPLDPLAR